MEVTAETKAIVDVESSVSSKSCIDSDEDLSVVKRVKLVDRIKSKFGI